MEAETELRAAANRPGFAGYAFGNAQDEVLAERQPTADAPVTDARGRATIRLLAGQLPKTARPLEMEAFVRLVEAGGRAVQRTIVLPLAPAGSQIGVKPLFADRVREGETANFDVVVAGVDDKLLASPGLTWKLSRIETRYQWYRVSGSWDYEPVKTVTRVGEGTIATTADGPARLSVPTQYGRYRLDLTGDGLPLTSVTFEAGFGGDGNADTPDRLELTLDKQAYAAGDTLEATLTARTAGTATVMVVNDGVRDAKVLQVQPGASKVSFKVEGGWGPGAYVVAFLHRPLDVQASRMPGRAMGLSWFSVDKEARTLKVELSPPAEMRPNTTLAIPVKVSNLPAGEKAYVTVAAVDVGILNLTGYKPPAPDNGGVRPAPARRRYPRFLRRAHRRHAGRRRPAALRRRWRRDGDDGEPAAGPARGAVLRPRGSGGGRHRHRLLPGARLRRHAQGDGHRLEPEPPRPCGGRTWWCATRW